MGSSEQGKRTPQEHVIQLAKDTIGIGAGQRYRKRHENDPDRLGVNLSAGAFGINQLFVPIVERIIEGYPTEKHNPVANIALFLDLGIDVGAILLAMTGHIGEGVAAKVVYNASVNALLDITSRKSPIPPAGTK